MRTNDDKINILNKKIKGFFNLSDYEKHNIDNNEKYDGIFDLIDEMSNVVISFEEKQNEKNTK